MQTSSGASVCAVSTAFDKVDHNILSNRLRYLVSSYGSVFTSLNSDFTDPYGYVKTQN